MTVDANFLSPLNFIFTINKMPKANMMVQRASIPGVNLGDIQIPTPFTPLAVPGNVKYDPLMIDFLINEDLSTYLEIFNWMVELGNPYDFSTYDSTEYDARLLVLDNSKRNILDVSFHSTFPVSLSPVNFDTTFLEPSPITATVMFSFNSMKFNT